MSRDFCEACNMIQNGVKSRIALTHTCGLEPGEIPAGKLGGFFDLKEIKYKCNHPEHNPPKHLHIPQSKGYKHICPGCGQSCILIPPQITM